MNYFGALLASRPLPLMLPRDREDEIHRYVVAHQMRGMTVQERSPFGRQLDFWSFSLACALALELPPLADTSNCRRFVDTRAVQMGDELCELLAIVAFDKIGHNDPAASDPISIVDMANRLAGAGTSVVLRKLQEGFGSTPLEKALDLAEESRSTVLKATDVDVIERL